MSALLDVLAGTARLSRRDRCALSLALECVRVGSGDEATSALCTWYPHGAAAEVALAIAESAICGPDDPSPTDRRLVRARLALLLRLVLRCDRGDPPPAWWLTWWYLDRPTTSPVETYTTLDDAEADHRDRCDRIVPLWEQAPATRAR